MVGAMLQSVRTEFEAEVDYLLVEAVQLQGEGWQRLGADDVVIFPGEASGMVCLTGADGLHELLVDLDGGGRVFVKQRTVVGGGSITLREMMLRPEAVAMLEDALYPEESFVPMTAEQSAAISALRGTMAATGDDE